jgi:hypothetical protein
VIDIAAKRKGREKGGGRKKKITDQQLKKDFNALKIPIHNRATLLATRYGQMADTIRRRIIKAGIKLS